MEIASCSIPQALHISFTKTITSNRYFSYQKLPRTSNFDCLPSLSPPTFPISFKIPRKFLQFNGFTAFSSLPNQESENPSQELAVLLEFDGIFVDAYRFGNRQAFNAAFKKLGLDCANWSGPVYADLVKKNAGDEERMLFLFFNRIGWPTSLPTSEKESFVKRVLREKKNAMDELLLSGGLPLRPGLEDFIDEANNEGVPVIVLTAYCKSGEKVARSIIEKLGDKRISKIKIVGIEEVEQSLYGQLVLGKRMSCDLDEQLAEEVKRAASAEKQRIAKEVASILKLSVDLDTSSSERLQKIIATLRAGAESAGLPFQNCILIAGSKPGVNGAAQIGMPCVVLRSR
ncbi:uncharacterized protein LOC110806891 isoform X2 [Carica papaya]|uniref:uncharacterized protein LOC110806891 isoform X2 n=1 Tax=Carica papaya TaxID=3649 RepID=UPI000B8C7DCA|nr:uncharacterized protein LOC110806891 isoform X2 [Carica papaya]